MEMKTMSMEEMQDLNGGETTGNTATMGGRTYYLPDGWTYEGFQNAQGEYRMKDAKGEYFWLALRD